MVQLNKMPTTGIMSIKKISLQGSRDTQGKRLLNDVWYGCKAWKEKVKIMRLKYNR